MYLHLYPVDVHDDDDDDGVAGGEAVMCAVDQIDVMSIADESQAIY